MNQSNGADQLPELVTASEEEYESLALTLATSKDKLDAIRQKLLANRHKTPLFDTATYTKNLEKAYFKPYQRHKDGLAPVGFKII